MTDIYYFYVTFIVFSYTDGNTVLFRDLDFFVSRGIKADWEAGVRWYMLKSNNITLQKISFFEKMNKYIGTICSPSAVWRSQVAWYENGLPDLWHIWAVMHFIIDEGGWQMNDNEKQGNTNSRWFFHYF